jgi:hypothetical protein
MPWIFRADDLEELRTSPKMVARKFDMTVEPRSSTSSTSSFSGWTRRRGR